MFEFLPAPLMLTLFIVIIGVLAFLGERSIRRQQGSMLKRGKEERYAVARFLQGIFRWPGSGGGGL